MILVTITALLAVCSADKLDRTYLPPPSAQSAGGSPGSLRLPAFNQGLGGLPQGAFNNDNDGVVVEAAAAGTRSSESGSSGLGAPREYYGSFNSKVGEAAFKVASQQAFGGSSGAQRINQQNFGSSNEGSLPGSNLGQELAQSNNFQDFNNAPQIPERPQASADRSANTLAYKSSVDTDKFDYAFETDNGIKAEQNGVENNGIQSQGGYSYTGDDGMMYSVVYTADEGGYKPQGSHLPTSPPIPEEILKALEKNAQDEAAGIIDDGSYDARKYNTGGEYTESENDNGKYNGQGGFSDNRGSAANAGAIYNQNSFGRPTQSAQYSSSGFNSEASSNPSNPSLNVPISQSSNEKPSNQQAFSNKPVASLGSQGSTFNSAAQFTSQVTEGFSNPSSNIPISQSVNDKPSNDQSIFNKPIPSKGIGSGDSFNANSNVNAPVLDSFNRVSSQTTGNRNPSFIIPESTFSTPSNSFASNVGQIQQSYQRPSFNKEYLPPTNSLQVNVDKSQSLSSDTSSQRNPSQNFPSSSLNQQGQQSPQLNSFQQNSASAQAAISSSNDSPINSNLQFIDKRFNYQQPTLQPDIRVTSPAEVPTSFQTAASASASLNFQAKNPTLQPTNFPNQFNQKVQSFNRPPAAFESNLNRFSQNQISSTAQSSFNEYKNNNDAYYYKQPQQPFRTASQDRPSAFSNQLNNIPQQTPSSASQNMYSNGFVNQGPSTTVTYPSPQTAAPTVPTSATQNNLGLNQVPQFSGITQATASSFVSSENAQSFDSQPSTQQTLVQNSRFPLQPSRKSFGQRPASMAVPSFEQQSQNTPNVPLSENVVFNQQYSGKLYQYNKPAEVPSAPEATASSSSTSFIKQSQNTANVPIYEAPVKTQQYNSEVYEYNKPAQFSTTPDKHADSEEYLNFQSSPSKVQSSVGGAQSQFGQKLVFNEQSAGEIYDYMKPSQDFSASTETEKQESNSPKTESAMAEVQPTIIADSNSQISQNNGFAGSSIKPVCCKEAPNRSGSFSSSATSSFSSSPSGVQNVAGRGEVFSASRRPPSYDPDTGYHY